MHVAEGGDAERVPPHLQPAALAALARGLRAAPDLGALAADWARVRHTVPEDLDAALRADTRARAVYTAVLERALELVNARPGGRALKSRLQDAVLDGGRLAALLQEAATPSGG